MAVLKKIMNRSSINTLTKAILLTLGMGMILTMAIMAPNAIQILKPFLGRGKRKDHEKRRIRQGLVALRRRRFVRYFEKGGNEYIRVTTRGRAYIRRLEIESLTLPQCAWDKKWRVILFDIPERKGRARRAFQQRLQSLGCMRLQKSVFVYPHACRDEIYALTSFWMVSPFVQYLETADLGDAQGRARKFFRFL